MWKCDRNQDNNKVRVYHTAHKTFRDMNIALAVKMVAESLRRMIEIPNRQADIKF